VVEVHRQPEARGLRVVVAVQPGEPVTVAKVDVRIDGPARDDRFVTRELGKLVTREGKRLVHAEYEADKARIDRKLAERGYFQAKRLVTRVEVQRAAKRAEVQWHWTSGPRHALGSVRFAENAFAPGLLAPLVDWRPGEPFHRNRLSRLQQRLAQLDYFAMVEVGPADEAVGDDLQVPIDVLTTPARRTTYTGALSVGSDSGIGLRAGFNRRWINARGHKLLGDAEWSQVRSALSGQYRIPSFRGLPGWITTEASAVDEGQAGVLGFERRTLRLGWRGQREPWTLAADLVAARESPRSRTRIFTNAQRLAYPEFTLQYREVDDPVAPEAGLQWRGVLRFGAIDALLQRRRFVQLTLGAQWLQAFGARDRLLLRADAGTTSLDGTRPFSAFPTSLRYFAGGDRSIRGYGYREIGPRFAGEVLGGLHLLTASAEFQHDLDDTWGLAAFVDGGDAVNARRDYDPKLGVGVGLRWRSPVGLVAIDVARGLDREAGGGTRLHLGFGVAF
jgi:translocation and assembly module TamA